MAGFSRKDAKPQRNAKDKELKGIKGASAQDAGG